MNDRAVLEVLDRAGQAFEGDRFDEALSLYLEVLDTPGIYIEACYQVAFIFERGLSSSGVDLDRALTYYLRLSEVPFDVARAGDIGVARVIYRMNEKSRFYEIIDYCDRAILKGGGAHAHMLKGAVYEFWLHQPAQAREQYLIAFREGLPWGLRYFARSLIRARRVFVGVLTHFAATVLFPFYVLRYGPRSPFG